VAIVTAAPPSAFFGLRPFFLAIGLAVFLLLLRPACTTSATPREVPERPPTEPARKPSGEACAARQLIARHDADMMRVCEVTPDNPRLQKSAFRRHENKLRDATTSTGQATL
jgi:hypothetical protein